MKEEPSFSALDRHFGDFLQRLAGAAAPEVRLAAMSASRARAEGHVCVALAELAVETSAATLRKKLRASKVVGAPGNFTPLILDAQDRLYLRRYWEYEQELAAALRERAQTDSVPSLGEETDLQQVAAARAVRHRFTVITGGPGTGKTRTVTQILTLLLAEPGGEQRRIALAAPTGKAAARLTESVRVVRQSLEATTLHRLLGYLPGSPYFRHDAEHPLDAEVVIVDEASMIDLALMAKLFAAVRPEASLVLLGDRDQLASVEAGSVLADICAAAEAALPNEPLHGRVVALRRNYRFAENSGIFRASAAVNAGDAEAAIAELQRESSADARWQPLPSAAGLCDALRLPLLEAFRPCLDATDPRSALARLNDFRVLCAVRHGPFGVENVNALGKEVLASAGLLAPEREFYRGRPLLITQNDYNLDIFNGDSGIVLPDPESDGELRAFFLSADGRMRRFVPSRLPQHETAFALTVHKSQGSEFDRVLLILPEKESPLLTRELLYTAITRARSAVEIWSSEAILRAAIGRKVTRNSGLRAALLAGNRDA